jgi:chaperonin GroES
MSYGPGFARERHDDGGGPSFGASRGKRRQAGCIISPETAREKPQEGEVIAVGPGARNEKGDLGPLTLKAGDRMLFGTRSGSEVKIDGEDLLIVKESDVLGVIQRSDARKKAA